MALELVMERIYQRRNGGTVIHVDILLKNTSNSSWTDRLRIFVPFSLSSTALLKSVHNEERAKEVIQKLRTNEHTAVNAVTHELEQHRNPANWIYTVIPHLEINHAASGAGQFVVNRYQPTTSGSAEQMSGYIKRGWVIQSPDGLDDWTWLVFAQFNTTLIDLVRDSGSADEMLKSGEQMWVRLRLTVPPAGFNKKSLLERCFARSLEYEQEFKSPGKVLQDIRTVIRQFDPDKTALNQTLDPHIAAAKRNAITFLPENDTPSEVKDWRAFLYHEHGLQLVSIDTPSAQPPLLSVAKQYSLPISAVPKRCKRSQMPRVIDNLVPWFRDQDRICHAKEFFFGTYYPQPYCNERHDSYSFASRTRSQNSVYEYLTWLAFILSLLALLIALR